MKADEKYMSMAVRLAEKGAGFVNPNPRVGAVIVKNDRVIGRGYHEYFGGPHAEVMALGEAGTGAKGATLYVTLEPCNHEGKTPPCAPLILSKGIIRVVVGMNDPNPGVKGNGKGFLEERGIVVTTGVLENKVRIQNEIFLKYITTKRPFCVLKSAISLDGKTATATGESKWISGEGSRAHVHSMRNGMAAVLVGAGTVLKDDPLLTVRKKGRKFKNPLKIILDSSGRIPLTAKVFTNEPQLCIVATTIKADANRNRDLERLGVQVIICPDKNGHADLDFLVRALGAMGIDSLLVESGGTLAFAALEAGIVDKVTVFIAPRILGGSTSPTMVGGEGFGSLEQAVKLERMKWSRCGEDVVVVGYIIK